VLALDPVAWMNCLSCCALLLRGWPVAATASPLVFTHG
jgi:hypothetical protein